MYNLENIEMSHDPYDAFPDLSEMRTVCKCAMMMILNCASRKSAEAAFRSEIRDNPIRFNESSICMNENSIKTCEVFDKVEALNPKIKHHFYNSACKNAMDIEASILFKTMEILIRNFGIPSIQVFDELIVPASAEKDALNTFNMVWKQQLKHTPLIKKEPSSTAVSYLEIYDAA
jgi:hypothetical protein